MGLLTQNNRSMSQMQADLDASAAERRKWQAGPPGASSI
jgi:hypothetical protein